MTCLQEARRRSAFSARPAQRWTWRRGHVPSYKRRARCATANRISLAFARRPAMMETGCARVAPRADRRGNRRRSPPSSMRRDMHPFGENHHGSDGTESGAGRDCDVRHAGRHRRGDPRIVVRPGCRTAVRRSGDRARRDDLRDRAQRLAEGRKEVTGHRAGEALAGAMAMFARSVVLRASRGTIGW
ncbi:hypothetical protein BURPSS13_C0072 [Burkholderia pseudomallei S13]|nr:hypothetical protein BURPSS13_C0072 [Burkholderia pseudomallei S13]